MKHPLSRKRLGSAALKGQVLEGVDGKLGEHHSGELRRESGEAKAERILAEEPRRMGWAASDLAGHRKSDRGKLALAVRLRNETTRTIKEITRRVRLGISRSANVRLHEWLKSSARTVPRRAGIRKKSNHVMV